MDELRECLLRDDNLAAAGRIARALVDAEAAAVHGFHGVVDGVLRETIEDLPEVEPDWAYLAEESHVRKAIAGHRKLDTGLYYPAREGVWLYVGGADRLCLAVYCLAKEYPDVHGELKAALALIGGGTDYVTEWAPWFRWLDQSPAWTVPGEWLHIRNPNDATLGFLGATTESQTAFARALAEPFLDLWMSIKEHDID